MARRTSTNSRDKSKYSSKISLAKLKKSKYNRKIQTPRSYYRAKQKQQEQAEALGMKEKAARQEHIELLRSPNRRSRLQTPTALLRWAGILFLLLAIIGFIMPNYSFGGFDLYLTPIQNYTHLIVGAICIASSIWAKKHYQKWLAIVIGFASFFFAISGFLVLGQTGLNYYGFAHLGIVDIAIYFVVGLWAILAVKGR